VKTNDKIKDKEKRKLKKAEKEFKKIQDEISPFIRKKSIKQHSTAGEWINTSQLKQYIRTKK